MLQTFDGPSPLARRFSLTLDVDAISSRSPPELLPGAGARTFAIKTPNPSKNPPSRLLFIALAGPFCVLGNLEKPEESKLNSERREWVFRDLGTEELRRGGTW